MERRLNAIINEILEIEVGEISDDIAAHQAEYWDSMNHLRLITAVEQEFEIRLTMAEIQAITCIRDLKDTIRKHVYGP